ncbi:MAG: hypothetical protein ACHQNV_04315 [Vicinamibacteria bacterium]
MAAMRVVLVAGLIGALPSTGLFADEAPARTSERLLDEGLGLSVNRLGLQNTLDLARIWRLSASRNPLVADAHVSLGITHTLTPSYTRLGPWVEVAPLSVFDVRLGAEGAGYFGTFGSLMSFAGYGDSFSDELRNSRKDEAQAGIGSRLYVSPTVKMRVGPVLAASGADFEWWRSNASGPLYYEPSRDTLLKVDGDRLVASSSVVLVQHEMKGRGTIAWGLSHNLTYVFAAPSNRSQRVGVVLLRQFTGRRFGLKAPKVAGQVSYYLYDPTRKGQLTAALGLSMGLSR